jgi:hypothetical protein
VYDQVWAQGKNPCRPRGEDQVAVSNQCWFVLVHGREVHTSAATDFNNHATALPDSMNKVDVGQVAVRFALVAVGSGSAKVPLHNIL